MTLDDRHVGESRFIPGPSGLKPTLRQLMIVTLWIALLLAASRQFLSWGVVGHRPESFCPSLTFHEAN